MHARAAGSRDDRPRPARPGGGAADRRRRAATGRRRCAATSRRRSRRRWPDARSRAWAGAASSCWSGWGRASPTGGDAGPAGRRPAVLTVHLKMTGQLFVVEPATPQDRHVHLVLAWPTAASSASATCASSGGSGCTGAIEATGEPVDGEAAGRPGRAAPSRSPTTSRRAGSRRAARQAPRPPEDAAAEPGLPGRRRQHLRRRISLAGAAPPAPRRAHRSSPADVRRLHGALRDVLAEAVERRGSSVDDYTAPEGDGSMQEHLAVYQRAGEPCLRCGRPIRRIVVGGRSTHFCSWCQRLPAAQRQAVAAARRPEATADRAAGRRGPRWTELSGEGALGRTPDEEERARPTGAAERARARAATRKARAPRGRRAPRATAGGPA